MQNNTHWPTHEWKVAEPSTLGMDGECLKQMEHMIHAKYKNINGILIVRYGCIAYERYYNGFTADDKHHVASVTKSYISALIGIAIEAGYIQSIDQSIGDYFPDVYMNGVSRQHLVTIRHLLTMTAPFPWKHEPLDRLRRQKNWVGYILKQLGRGNPTGTFQYSTAGTHLLSAIISKATGMSAREYANKYLFAPIGMKEIPDYSILSYGLEEVFGKKVRGWVKDPQGITAGGWGLTVTPREMARFGLLYLNKGYWNHRSIISEEWIEESLAMNANQYGYLWWLIDKDNTTGYTAAGSGGNHIICIPEKDLVVAIASKVTTKPQDRWPLLKDYILPAISEG